MMADCTDAFTVEYRYNTIYNDIAHNTVTTAAEHQLNFELTKLWGLS